MRFGTLALVDHIAVPGEAIGFQCAENQVSGARLFSRWIYIFNTKKPEPILGPGLQIAGYSGNKRAEVQRAGRRGRKPANVLTTGSDRPGRGTGVRQVPGAPAPQDTA